MRILINKQNNEILKKKKKFLNCELYHLFLPTSRLFCEDATHIVVLIEDCYDQDTYITD